MSNDILHFYRAIFFFKLYVRFSHPREIIPSSYSSSTFSFLISLSSVISANCFRIVFVLYFFFLSFFLFFFTRKVKKKNGRTGGGWKIRKPHKPVTGLSGIYLSSPLPPRFFFSPLSISAKSRPLSLSLSFSLPFSLCLSLEHNSACRYAGAECAYRKTIAPPVRTKSMGRETRLLNGRVKHRRSKSDQACPFPHRSRRGKHQTSRDVIDRIV